MYSIQFKELAILMFHREIQYGASGYIKDDYVTDIFEIDDEDNVWNRILNNYANGLKALKNEDLVSAYKFFYVIFPDGSTITDNPELNTDLRLLRDGASHRLLDRNRKLVERAKELLGEEFVKTKDDKTYAYIDETLPRHIDLFKKYIPIVKKSAKDYLDKYIESHK